MNELYYSVSAKRLDCKINTVHVYNKEYLLYSVIKTIRRMLNKMLLVIIT